MPTIIRKDHTLDRPECRVTAEEVFDAMKSLHDLYPGTEFTTSTIAEYIITSGSCRGIGYERVERAVRASVDWLVRRRVAYQSGTITKTYVAGTKEVNLYGIHEGRTWNKRERKLEQDEPDYQLLNLVFLRA